jgi:hypothetical protein|tara:strand:- start:7190 stop:7465 length:276 start_codon:yes stop_codon:yes gene_type:complete
MADEGRPEQGKVQAEIMQAYRDIFLHTPQGQMIMVDLLKASGLFVMTGVRSDSELQHMTGARDMVRRIISILALDEEQLLKLATGDITNAE